MFFFLPGFIPPGVKNGVQKEVFNVKYTMESERSIFDAFIRNFEIRVKVNYCTLLDNFLDT